MIVAFVVDLVVPLEVAVAGTVAGRVLLWVMGSSEVSLAAVVAQMGEHPLEVHRYIEFPDVRFVDYAAQHCSSNLNVVEGLKFEFDLESMAWVEIL